MPVHEPGDEQPARQADDVAALARPGGAEHAGDAPARDFHGDPAPHPAIRREHEVGHEQRAAHGSIGRSRPRARAVSRASG